jgi:Skp family chaperone for outer membrane proteins
MTKTCTLALALLATGALAQETAAQAPSTPPAAPAAAKAPPRTPKIGVIDMGKVSSDSLLGKGLAAQLETLRNEINSEGTKKQAEIDKMSAQIAALQEELQKQENVLSPEAVDKKKQEIVKKERDRRAFGEDSQAEIERMKDRAQQKAQGLDNEFQSKIKPHIEAVVKERAIDILLDGRVVLGAVPKEFDISQDVVIKSDDAERAQKGKAAAEKPAAPKPAAPASPAPTPTPQP